MVRASTTVSTSPVPITQTVPPATVAAPDRRARTAAFLLARSSPTRWEVFGALMLLGFVGAAFYGTHITRGGLYSDDWAFLTIVRHSGGLSPAFDVLRQTVGLRPVGIVSILLRWDVLGEHVKLQLFVVMASVVTVCTSYFVVLRSLRIERVHAGAIALLVLVVPYADATRLWATGSGANIAIALWLIGVAVALHGLRASTRKGRIAWHAGAVAIFVASLLQYEVAYPAICLGGVLYLTRAPWRRALRYAVVDIAAASVTVAFIVTNESIPKAVSYTEHARLIFDGALTILARIAVPFGTPSTALVLAILGLVALTGGVVAWMLPRQAPERAELIRWLTVAAVGLVLGFASYSMYIGATEYYEPLTPGLPNRINAIPTMGFIATVYALAIVAGVLAFRGLRHWRFIAAGVAVAAGVFMFIGFDQRERASQGVWNRTYANERVVIGQVKGAVPKPPPYSTIFTYGYPAVSENAGLPIFSSFFELRSALQIHYDDPTINGYVALPGTALVCARDRAYLSGDGYPRSYGNSYGKVYLVDVPSKRTARPLNQRQCKAAAPMFVPGPLSVSAT